MDDGMTDTFKKLKNWFQESRDNTDEWRGIAVEDFDFVAGHHWTEEEKRILRSEMRPIVAFNRINPVIAAVRS